MGVPGGVSAYWGAAFSAQQSDTFGWREYFAAIDGSAETDIVQTETGKVVLDTVSSAWAYQYHVGITYQKMLVGMVIALNRLTWIDPNAATNYAPFHAFGTRVGARGWFGWNKDRKV